MKFDEFLQWEKASRNSIDFKKVYVYIANEDIIAGLILSQIIYWFLPTKKGGSKASVQRDGYAWIAKKADDWWDECCIKSKAAARAIQVLEEVGVIETAIFKFAGNPTTHIRIIEDQFLALLEVQITQDTGVGFPRMGENDFPKNGEESHSDLPEWGKTKYPNGGFLSTETTAETTEKRKQSDFLSDGVRERSTDLFTGETPNQEPNRIARIVNRLYDALASKRKIMRKPRLKQWESSIRQFFLSIDMTVTPDEFEKELDWYIKHIGEAFVPQVYSAQAFCDRFVSIQDARMRWEREHPDEAPSTPPQQYVPAPKTIVNSGMTEEELHQHLIG